MNFVDFFKEIFNKEIVEQFNDLIDNNYPALRMYCRVYYTEPKLLRQQLKKQDIPSKKSPYRIKEYFVSIKKNILDNYNIQVNYNNKLKFQELILSVTRRAKYYKNFLSDRNIENNDFYCLNRIPELDLFIKSYLKKKYDKLCLDYPDGCRRYKDINDSEFGDNLEGDDFFESCIEHEDYIIKLNEEFIKYKALYDKHKEAIDIYCEVNETVSEHLCCVFRPSYAEILSHDEDFWSEYLKSHQIVKKIEDWIELQFKFGDNCVEIAKEIIPNWGRYFYLYDINMPWYENKTRNRTLRVWQFFCESFCVAKDLDYSLYPSALEHSEEIKDLLSYKIHYKEHIYQKIIKFIKSSGVNCVFFADSDSKEDITLNKRHFKSIIDYLESKEMPYFFLSEFINETDKELILSELDYYDNPSQYAVIELVSNNDRLIKNCKFITQYLIDLSPRIIYISLMKEYSQKEMSDILKEKYIIQKQKLEQEEKERQARIRQQEEKKRKLEEEQHKRSLLVAATSNWDSLTMSLKTFSLFNYYPTTCDFEATEDEWCIRNLIWDFKAAPNKPEPITITTLKHKNAIDEIVPKLSYCLKAFFGDNLSLISFACIPASSQIKTARRFEDFSNILCTALGMVNAYPYIHVKADAVAKHLGGSGLAEIEIDKNFFKDKFVIMFDDVITRGNSMIRFKSLLENAGAIVIGGISIGRTKHHRSSNSIDNIEHYIFANQKNQPHSSPNNDFIEDDDLPF